MRIAFAAPAFLLTLNEFGAIDEAFDGPLFAAIIQMLWWGGVLATVRFVVSTSADRSLGRVVARSYTTPATVSMEGAA